MKLCSLTVKPFSTPLDIQLRNSCSSN